MPDRLVLRPKAYSTELDRKVAAAAESLANGNHVQVEIPLRGRETGRPELATRVLDRLLSRLDPKPVVVGPLRVRDGVGRAVLSPPGMG